ncbi:site-specific integrase [Brevibacterium casei]|uniref:Tyr recombinase domain-containing protein n=1 Tax=Brevibacterium metallidurans TaxID=1482676 RepID=A0ABN0SLP8_9MICO|nr:MULTISPECIES: site-specific integrase [Micrococcales]MBN9606280.1 site-specific integrase [Actinomycetales bacterium]MCT2019984.1 site-specific integrase [Kocuria marina]
MVFMDGQGLGSGASVPAGKVTLLRPAEQLFDEMLTGWTAQQTSRMLTTQTIKTRASQVRRFGDFCGTPPWEWSPADVEEWTTSLVSGARPLSTSTVRAYQNSVALFCDYLTDHRYGWADRCEELFGTHPVQVCHEWNTVIHTSDHEARPAVRPLNRLELQAFFDYADDLVDRARSSGRKGWQTLFRDATLFKIIYAFGLRRREAAMLDLHDFTRNPKGPEFGRFGVCNVRWGKAMRGSQPRRRAVLAVFDWTRPVIEEYVTEVRPRFGTADESVLWPTERQSRIRLDHIDDRFADWRDDLGLDPVLHPHCLRHSYVTHLIEDGFDPLFVQQQVGHRWGSTTALYTGVSGDYRNRTLRRALDAAFTPPTAIQEGSSR